ncbi:cytochrome P450 [Leucogyrophana mollusca]|uniref:Cytochrome P450 n=1 Tax=Leucogyrophana mollusca TaxID=85980 RepID=A0ACB8B0V5_9AGAM|nr:cytochrome P450 [Leucogyrophana mollusca]
MVLPYRHHLSGAAETDMYYDIIDGFVDALTSAIEAEDVSGRGRVCLMYDLLRNITLDTICATAFGYKCNTTKDPSDPLAKAFGELLDLQSGPNIAGFFLVLAISGMATFLSSEHVYRLRHWFHLLLASPSTPCIASRPLQRILAEQIAELEAADPAPAPKRRDMMSLFLQARSAKKGERYQISDTDMLTFLVAGHEPTASALSWTLWLLANHKATQNKLREEVMALVADNPRPDYRSLKDSPCLEAVIMESLRLFSPVPMMFRKAAKDTEIDGTFVPEGTLIYIPWKEHWGDDVEEFRPERWHSLPETYNPAFSLLSFSAGPHGCIGRTMAMMEMKAVLAIVIAKFEFDLAYPGQVAKPRAGVTMRIDALANASLVRMTLYTFIVGHMHVPRRLTPAYGSPDSQLRIPRITRKGNTPPRCSLRVRDRPAVLNVLSSALEAGVSTIPVGPGEDPQAPACALCAAPHHPPSTSPGTPSLTPHPALSSPRAMSTLKSPIETSAPRRAPRGPTKVFEGHTEWVNSVAYFPDGRCMASGSGDGAVIIWDIESGRQSGQPLQHHSSVEWIAISPDGRRIASGMYDGGLVIWDVQTREVVHEIKGGGVYRMAYSPDGRWIATAPTTNNREVRLWDADTGRLGREPLECEGGVEWVAFSPDGSQIAIGFEDGSFQGVDISTGEIVVGPIQGHMSAVRSLVYSPDGRLLVTGSWDRSIRVWQCSAGRRILTAFIECKMWESRRMPANSG